MKLNKWSIVKTASARGVAVKPPEGGAHHYEVCVSINHGMLEINVFVDSVMFPVASMTLPLVKGN